jgi:GntR family transcriptional regulator
MDVIGQRCTRVLERNCVRRAEPWEAESLGLKAGASVLLDERTIYAGNRAVETADIVFPPGHRLTYEIPVRDA